MFKEMNSLQEYQINWITNENYVGEYVYFWIFSTASDSAYEQNTLYLFTTIK